MRTVLHHRKRRPHCTKEELTAPWNLLRVSWDLHNWIHNNVDEARQRGWLVNSWEDTRDVPVTPDPELREVA